MTIKITQILLIIFHLFNMLIVGLLTDNINNNKPIFDKKWKNTVLLTYIIIFWLFTVAFMFNTVEVYRTLSL